MSRRKQARPIRHLEGEEAPAAPVNGDSIGSGSEEDGLAAPVEQQPMYCDRCQEQFLDRTELLAHVAQCTEIKEDEDDDETPSDTEDIVDEENQGKTLEQARRHCQDVSNNNSLEERDGDEDGEAEEGAEGGDDNVEGEVPAVLPFPAASHVTLEALQNTKVAVAQFAATAMANNADNEAALQELAVLQSTLFTLQHQQVFQLQLIQQLQSQLSINRPKEDQDEEEGIETPPNEECSQPPSAPPSPVMMRERSRSRSRSPSRSPSPVPSPPPLKLEAPPHTQLPPVTQSIPIPATGSQPLQIPRPPSPIMSASHPPMCSISSSLASTIITNNDPQLPLDDQPNTLEMLQRRAQEVLDSASQGLLAGNLADELAFRKSGKMSPFDGKSGGRNEPFFKHRCRYCGKVFGSDSALQIHIRSHTGERPFKCNVCGSRFTTKGNLKVHFQRHTAKFPHVKMNPNPIPEHLDKYHPPLLAQMSPGPMPGMSPHGPVPFPPSGAPYPPTGIPLYRPPLDLLRPPLEHKLPVMPPHPMFVPQMEPMEQEGPADLSKPAPPSPPPPPPPPPSHDEGKFKSEPQEEEPPQRFEEERVTPKREPEPDRDSPSPDEVEQEPERFPAPSPYMEDECSMESKYSNEEMTNKEQDQPENLSSKTSPPLALIPRFPPSFPFPPASSPPSSTSSGSASLFQNHGAGLSGHSDMDPTKDPIIYSNLLPRPGSNDNSWESLIEVTKTSETHKLQQLVDNIEHKLTDPNQCVICHRVLSCKSALQMHYRTHTGERPFRCRICGRAFTTKGNLKTHMGVHRMKPPMRALHQCPVCHKKFSNALVLQQHIRLHTGEPTDLTPEQIQAAEVRDFPSPGPGGYPMGFMGPGFPLPPGFPMGFKHDLDMKDMEGMEDFMEDDEDFDDEESTSDNTMMPNFSTSLAALENQVRTMTTMASQLSASGLSQSAEDLSRVSCTPTASNGDKSPMGSEAAAVMSPSNSEVRTTPPQINIPRPPSSIRAHSPTPSDGSQGALDLTPRGAPQPSPPVGPQPPGVFSNFALLPPGPPVPGSPLMTSALSSLTSSVLTSTAFSPLGLAVGPTVRGNTTCNICYKTFACHSALEIHYRSHTKERPFKCAVCDRGFSTKSSGGGRSDAWGCTCPREPPKLTRTTHATALHPPGLGGLFLLGNMKQHMLTHKIRDMPQHMFDNNSKGDESMESDGPPPPLPPPEQLTPPPPPVKQEIIGIKRSPPEAELPVPKRPSTGIPPPPPPAPVSGAPLSSKHLCGVCRKNFSSSSALQIHMRTHTGDKPFRCTVCQKAFTTKGNLKVHMGTHMWSNGASRRGRRMSLELPPRPLPLSPQDSDFLQRRPDLFYPYLPAPFLNGMQQKLNEISVIQQGNPNNGLTSPGNKYAGLLGFGPFPPPESLRSQPGSPLSDKPPSSINSPPPMGPMVSPRDMVERERERELMIREMERRELSDRDRDRDRERDNVLPRMWDLHYERKAANGASEEGIEVSPSSGLPLLNQPSRGEGLAA